MNENTTINTIPEHTEYVKFTPIWTVIDDCVEGEDAVKAKTTVYLHKTLGMERDTSMGQKMYDSYKYRASYPNYPFDFLKSLNGLLWQKDPVVNVPTEMENKFIPAPAFNANKSFMDVYHDISESVLKYSRHIAILDVPQTDVKSVDTYPIIVQYSTQQVKNWGETIYKGQKVVKFVVIDESYNDYNNAELTSKDVAKYRFLGLKTEDNGIPMQEPIYYTYTGDNWDNAVFDPPFSAGDDSVVIGDKTIIFPSINGRYMNQIPIVSFGITDIGLSPTYPIIYPLCKQALTIYRLDADYKEYLFKQGFAMLFGKGFKPEQDIYVGTQKALCIENPEADLKYVEISGVGLSEYRQAINDAHKYAQLLGLSLMKDSGDETGMSVMRRTTLKTASLKTISKMLAYGMTLLCKMAATWRGLSDADIKSITIQPNVEFSSSGSDAGSLVNVYSVWQGGTQGLTDYDYYLYLRNNNHTPYNTFEEWNKELKEDRARREAEVLKTASKQQKMEAKNTPAVSTEVTPTAKAKKTTQLDKRTK